MRFACLLSRLLALPLLALLLVLPGCVALSFQCGGRTVAQAAPSPPPPRPPQRDAALETVAYWGAPTIADLEAGRARLCDLPSGKVELFLQVTNRWKDAVIAADGGFHGPECDWLWGWVQQAQAELRRRGYQDDDWDGDRASMQRPDGTRVSVR